jgi:endonuclease YncB( thermonuclease family)
MTTSLGTPQGVPRGNSDTAVRVARVVHGDKIEISPAVDGNTEVRLIGVDTPETYGGIEPYGEEGSAFAAQRLDGRQLRWSSAWSE